MLVLKGIFGGSLKITLQIEITRMVKNNPKRFLGLGNAILFTHFWFAIFVPLNPPPSQPAKWWIKGDPGFPLEFLLEGPQTELRTLSQNCEQTLQKLRTNRIMNKRAFLDRAKKGKKGCAKKGGNWCSESEHVVDLGCQKFCRFSPGK